MARKKFETKLKEALCAGKARDYKSSIAILTSILAETDLYPDAWLFLGRAQHATTEYEKAITSFNTFLRYKNNNPLGLFFLGRSYLSIGRAKEAAYYLSKSIENKYKPKTDALALLGYAKLKLKQPDQAVSFLEEAVTLAPENIKIFHAYLNALCIKAIKLINIDPSEAASILNFVLKNGFSHSSLHVYRAKALRSLGQINEAISELEIVKKENPSDPEIRLQLAALYYASGNPEKGNENIEHSGIKLPDIKGAPWTEKTLETWRAAAAFKDGKYKETIATTHNLIRNGNNEASIFALTAQANYELGFYKKAASHYTRAIERDNANPDFRMGQALSLWQCGDYNGARNAAKAAAIRNAKEADVNYINLLCNAKQGIQTETILPLAQSVLHTRPGDPNLMLILAESLYKSGYPDLAKAWFLEVLSIWPKHELSMLYLISIAESLGNKKDTELYYIEYIEAYPDNYKIRKEFIHILMTKEKWTKAIKYLEESFIYQKSKRNAILLAICYRNACLYKEAAAAYRTLLNSEPKNVDFLLGLAYSLEKMGSIKLAIELLNRGSIYIANKEEPFLILGVLRAKIGDSEKAVNAFLKASELAPGDPRPLRNLANLYKKSGIYDMAKHFDEKAKSLE